MKTILKKLNEISLREDLEAENLSENLIESILEASDHDLEVAFICNTEEELDAVLDLMSSEDEGDDE